MKRKVFTDGNGSNHIFVEGLGEYSPKNDHDRLIEENQRLTTDMKSAISLMSPSWQHAASKELDLMTRYVTMAENQFKKKNKEVDRLTAIATNHATRADELYEALEVMVNQFSGDHYNEADYLAYKHGKETIDKSQIEAEKGDGICN